MGVHKICGFQVQIMPTDQTRHPQHMHVSTVSKQTMCCAVPSTVDYTALVPAVLIVTGCDGEGELGLTTPGGGGGGTAVVWTVRCCGALHTAVVEPPMQHEGRALTATSSLNRPLNAEHGVVCV